MALKCWSAVKYISVVNCFCTHPELNNFCCYWRCLKRPATVLNVNCFNTPLLNILFCRWIGSNQGRCCTSTLNTLSMPSPSPPTKNSKLSTSVTLTSWPLRRWDHRPLLHATILLSPSWTKSSSWRLHQFSSSVWGLGQIDCRCWLTEVGFTKHFTSQDLFSKDRQERPLVCRRVGDSDRRWFRRRSSRSWSSLSTSP